MMHLIREFTKATGGDLACGVIMFQMDCHSKAIPDGQRGWFPKTSTDLWEEIGVHERTARRKLNKLVESGFLEEDRERDEGVRNRIWYRLTLKAKDLIDEVDERGSEWR